MEDEVDQSRDVENKTLNELKSELAEAYKTIEEKKFEIQNSQRVLEENEAKVQRLQEKISLLEKQHLQSKGEADDREPEVEPSPILERMTEDILPKECWGLVFQNLNVEDMLRCRQVCKRFKKVLDLKEFVVLWRFHLILPILFPYLKSTPRNPWKHLYNTRLTCRSWCHSIDKYTTEVYGTKGFVPRPRQIPLLTCFNTSEDIVEFQEKFGECNTNPFPSKRVHIGDHLEEEEGDEYYETLNAYVENIKYLFRQFGKYVFKLHLYFDRDNSRFLGPLTLCKLIKNITIHLPDLKEFRIGFETYEGKDEYVDEEVEAASFIVKNTLGALPKLQALIIIGNLNTKVEDYLLDAFAPQLTHLERYSTDNSIISPVRMRRLENVEKLALELQEKSDYLLTEIRYIESPLKFLKLSFSSIRKKDWNMDEFLCNLQHLPIEYLEINFYFSVNVTEAGIDRKYYRNKTIKTLYISTTFDNISAKSRQFSFNFLQAMRKLENLEFKISGEQRPTTHPEEFPEIVKLNEYMVEAERPDMLYHSNVWEKVPSLKTVIVKRKPQRKVNSTTYTREKYERLMIDAE